jgi:NAD(P)-dependent dehydrogenase (short-subunit alcohol dehydrogenase family)
VDECGARLGDPTALVNAAGVLLRAGMLDHTRELWQRTLATNLDGPFWLSQAFTRRLLAASRPGTIVNVASIEALYPLQGHLAYSTSKGALVMLTRAMALELAPHGVRVNAVCPGVIETPMNAEVRRDPERSRSLRDLIPMGRFGSAEEVAELVEFLVSERSSYLTGAVVPVDGGWSVA